MMLRSVLRGFWVCFMAAMVLAPLSARADEKTASDYAATIGNQALTIITSKASDAQKQSDLEALFVKIVDTDWIAKFVIGAEWRKLKPAQQADYLQTYRKFLVKHYTSNFKEYGANTRFSVVKSHAIGGKGQYLVGMKVLRKGEPPLNLDYRVREDAAKKFMAIDIIVEGVSLLATQRSEFTSVIQRDGIDKLISLLKKKSA